VLAFASLTLPSAVLTPHLLRKLLPILALYGVFIELVQPWVGRHRDPQDWLADIVGLLIGAAIGLTLRRLLKLDSPFGALTQVDVRRTSR
jgi:VanZ family protein